MREYFAVTGLGLVTPLGIGVSENWGKLITGFSGIKKSGGLLTAQVAEISGRKKASEMLYCALSEAMNGVERSSSNRCCFVLSQSKPDIKMLENISEYMLGNDGLELSAAMGLKNYFVKNIVSACSTGVHSVYSAAQLLDSGKCDFAVVGVSESSLNDLYISAFKNMGVLTGATMRPFDKKRDGFAIGEGAGAVVIERMSSAIKRGAEIYSVIKACGASSSGNIINLTGSASKIAELIRKVIVDSENVKIDYINAHGTATKLNDKVEAEAIIEAFSSAVKGINISSTKAATGHLLGAAGIVEMIFCMLAVRHNIVPPTLNLDEPEFDLQFTPGKAVKRTVTNALSLSYGFGGQIGAVVCGKGNSAV